MRYTVTIGGRAFAVDLTGDVPLVEGEPVSADLQSLPGTSIQHLLANGRSVALMLERGSAKGLWDVHVDGRKLTAEVLDERTRAIREMTARDAKPRGPRPVRAPMPGLVVRVEVEPGQTVNAGQGIVIVEAMKMENELKAETSGIVARILVAAGQPVEKGAVLVEFEAVE